MINLKLITRDDEEVEITGKTGATLMETIRDSGEGDLIALCGGCCSCATCHVYIQEQYLAKLPSSSEDENDLLDCSDYRQQNSRLSCQVALTEELSDMVVTIAPED